MPAVFALDQVLTQGKSYRTPERACLVVEAIGTNATSPAYLQIEGKPTGAIHNLVAPLHRTSSNFLPLLELGRLYYVIPPQTDFTVVGPSGCKFRIKGRLLKLAPGEALPTDIMARYNEQYSHYLVHFSGVYSHGTDVALPADAEVEVFSLTPKTIETYRFLSIVEASVSNYTPAEEELAVRFLLDGAYLDSILELTKSGGVDILCMPRPPASGTNMQAFSLEKTPVEVLGDHTISIKVRNIKGSSITPATGTSLTFYVDGVAEYIRK